MAEFCIADKLREALLKTMNDVGLDMLKKSTEAIQDSLNCTEVSLWTINRNDTQVDGKSRPDGEFLSTSLISRTLNPNCCFKFDKKEDFTHDLSDDCFFKKVLQHKTNFVRTDKAGAIADKFKSERFITEEDINDVIAILITDKDSNTKNTEGVNEKIAILELSYSQSCLEDKDWAILSPILHDFLSAAFKRYTLIQQQNLLDDLIRLQDIHKDNTVEDLFREVIDKICTEHCPCQGASFFMWDSSDERYNLIHTTGLIELNCGKYRKDEVFYMKSEGITGRIGKYGRLFISDELSKEKESIHTSKICEEVIGDKSIIANNHTKTGMFIPIAYPNNSKEVVGILRLINKTNPCEPKFVDYFNKKIDGKTMEMASKYLSLVCDFYIKQDDQGVFISRMTHELNTPANAIHKSSDLLFKNIDDEKFLNQYLKIFLRDIQDLALMQKWQVATNLELLKRRKQLPFNVRYSLQEHNLFGIIQDSRNIAIPIARKYNVSFDNIHIDNSLKRFRLKVDKNAFITVFYNLLTNAIKYHDSGDDFRIYISGRILVDRDVFRITVEDNGIGINRREEKAIFEMGYRGKNALEQNAHGYGIGLPVIKQIIEDFGGEIYISSNRKPTIFIIDFQKNIIL